MFVSTLTNPKVKAVGLAALISLVSAMTGFAEDNWRADLYLNTNSGKLSLDERFWRYD